MDNLERLKIRIPEEKNDMILLDYLETAKNIIMARRFPYGTTLEDVEPRYVDLQLRIAVELYEKQGAEGETSHSENGISRTYESAGVSSSLLNEITPMCGVPE
jgi:hypothetical protein